MTIVTKNSLTLSNVNDGTITHTAYAYSADGNKGFTTVYPNLNLLEGSTKYTKDNPLIVSSSATDGWSLVPDVFVKNLKAGTYTMSGKADAPWTNHGWGDHNGKVGLWLVSTTPGLNVNINLGDTVPKTIEVPKDGDYCVRYNLYSNGTDVVTHKFWDFKLEQGSIATPQMPSINEVKTSDYPSYIGTYSDNNVESSSDYSKYQWAIFKGQNSNAYTAYSWSPDGTDRFSTVYPNFNLLVNSSAKTKDGFFKNFDKVENDYGEVTIKGTNTWVSKSLWDGFSIKPRDYTPGDKYTMSMDVMFTSWDFPTGTGVGEFWIGQRYSQSSDGTITSWKQICFIDLPKDPSQMLNQWIRITQTSTIPPYADPAVNTEARFLTRFTGTSEASFTVRVRKPKQELGSIATPWMPSESEAQEQWQDAIPMYIGVGEKDSQNPSDYRWQLNSKYVQASSDSGLSNKAGVDDLASVADTANDALVQAQNAVSNEDYTSWLEHDYQTTIDDLQDVSTQNQEDIRSVDDRTTVVEGFYDEMKIKWNFIDESFTFSEEGMFISNSQSKMAIQVTSDKIVFWDNDVDVAFITGEALNIQRGVFLESATIGNHLITKFSDDSPVTIITYVGGIN